MKYLGIDYHKSYSTISMMNESGQVKTNRVWNDAKLLTSYINKLVEGEKNKAVLEAKRILEYYV